MKTYLITDRTATHSGRYIGDDDKNCHLRENAAEYPTRADAEHWARKLDPENDWADVEEDEIPTVTLINPWSKAVVEKEIRLILRQGLDAYPWPDEVREALDGMTDTDEEWVAEAVKMMGAEQAGIVIIGS
jgi:hypothetical protein